MIAVTMPGNTGDMLYALPVTRVLCAAHDTKCDFYTAATSAHARKLLEYQPCVNEFIVPPAYKIERRDMGTQPWFMPVNEKPYEAVYHLGYRRIPDQPLHQFMAAEINIYTPLAVKYNFPDLGRPSDRPYVCISSRGMTSFNNKFNLIVEALLEQNIGVVVIGAKGDNQLAHQDQLMDFTGYDLLDTLSLLYHSIGYIGLLSSQLVLANGFAIPKVTLNGYQGDMRHVIQGPHNYYPPADCTVEQVVNFVRGV